MNKRDFTLKDLLAIFKKRWWIIILCALIVGSGFGFYSYHSYVPEYTSEVTFYVSPSNEMGNWDSSNDTAKVNWALKVINSYMAIIKTTDFSQELNDTYENKYAKEYKKYDIDYEFVRNSVSMSIISEEATLFKVKIKTPYADASYHIAKQVQELVPVFIENVTKTSDTVHVADTPKEPTVLSNSNHLTRNTAIGVMLGMLLAFLAFFLSEVFDVRIMSEEDITNNYTTPLLGTIPLFQSDNRSKRGKR